MNEMLMVKSALGCPWSRTDLLGSISAHKHTHGARYSAKESPPLINAPLRLQKLPRKVKVRSSDHLSFNGSSFKHTNFSDLRIQKVGGNWEIISSNFVIVLKRNPQPGRWEKVWGLWGPLWPWPAAAGWTRDWPAYVVSLESSLVHSSNNAHHIQLQIFGPYTFYPLILFPSAFSFIHSRTCTERFPCIRHSDRCCKPLKDGKVVEAKRIGLWRPMSLGKKLKWCVQRYKWTLRLTLLKQ